MSRYFAIIPAAGSGSRMGAECPKQYLELCGKPLLWHALTTLTSVAQISRVFVVLSPEDEWWESFDWSAFDGRLQVLRVGGATRADSVTNALRAIAPQVASEDWVLVHDAARACLSVAQVEVLIDTLADDPVGGLLAQPVADTLKRGDAASRVASTVSREAMWQGANAADVPPRPVVPGFGGHTRGDGRSRARLKRWGWRRDWWRQMRRISR